MSSGAALPEDWEPSRDEIDYGIDLGLSEMQVREMAEDMRLWAISNSNRSVAKKANWHTTFLGWMRRNMKGRFVRPHEKSYAEIADDMRREIAREKNGSGSSQGEPDLFTAFDTKPRSGRSR